jgi:hypothetical protein
MDKKDDALHLSPDETLLRELEQYVNQYGIDGLLRILGDIIGQKSKQTQPHDLNGLLICGAIHDCARSVERILMGIEIKLGDGSD